MCNDATVIIENNEVLATIVIDNNCEQFTIIASGLGTPGLSAYDIAVANGFIGTEAQWIASLQVSKTSDLINDGADGVHPFITLEDIPSVTISDATTTTKGIIKLAGDLSGTADLPTVPNKVDKVTGYSLTKNDLTDLLKAAYDSAVTWISTNGAILISHLTNYSNPHQTTAAQIGAYTTTQTDTLLNGKVPYTGANQNVDLGEFQLKVGQVEFDQTPTGTAGVGKLRWNDTDGTLDLGLKGGNVTLQVGQEQVLRVVNKTSTNVSLLETNYQAVRVTGAQGQRLKVDLALATNDSLSAETIGLVTETIANNQEGFITTSGLIRGINTTGSLQGETWADGDVIYLSPTTAGNVTNIKPIAPNHLIIIGYVVSAHITQGTIFVKVDNGYELNELHNVKIDTPLDAEVLGYENSTSLWKNKSIATWLGFTPENTANKQNSLALDGNGVKFPTIDAVNNLSFIDKMKRGIQFFTDFETIGNVIPNLVSLNTGSGASSIRSLSSIPNQQSNQVGFCQYQTGTTITGTSTHISDAAVSNTPFNIGGGNWIFETSLELIDLSILTDRFRVLTGFGNGVASSNLSNGIFFIYDEGGVSNGTTASAYWQCITSNGGVRTLTTTSVLVDLLFNKLRIEINPAGSSVVFKINGNIVATHTTNIPVGNSKLGIIQGISKSIGISNRSLICDYLGYENYLTIPR